ncbi:MAG: hypothetical protein GY755_04545, partial [Chloroflexi bacterium]|nr:hypothetical protein [Chloroflexota bacterium]
MKKFMWSMIICCVVLGVATISLAETLIVGGENAWPPFANSDGSGIGYDLVAAAFQAVGVEIEFRTAPYKRVMREAKDGEYIAYFHADKNPDNEDAFFWPSAPLFSGHTDYFHHIDRPLSATSEQELKNGERIGLVHGWGYGEFLLSNENVHKDWAPDEEKSLGKLVLERLDAVVLWYVREKDVQALLKKMKLEDKVVK